MKYMTYSDFVNDSEILSKEEKESFLNSPDKTKQIIEEFHQIPNDLAKLIQEQYESPDGTGFPRKLTATQINTISAVFILSGIFARYILNNRDNYSFDLFLVILERKGYNKGNFKEPFKYLKEIIESTMSKAS
jgi:response regulator RpfG family c-di-GMP phosphodiesterase